MSSKWLLNSLVTQTKRESRKLFTNKDRQQMEEQEITVWYHRDQTSLLL